MALRNRSVLSRQDGLPLIVTHGGAAASSYRNVLEALETSIAVASDMFEFDVRRTADEALVIHHDECIGADRLSDLTYAAAGREAAALGYQVPALEAVLGRAHGTIRLDVELKEAGYETAILRILRQHGYGPDDFVVTSFEQAALEAIHASDATVTTGLLVYDVSGPEALRLFALSGASFLGPDYVIVDDDMMREAAAAAVPLVPWTVNDTGALQRLMAAGALAGLITDRPAEAIDVRRRTAGGRDQ